MPGKDKQGAIEDLIIEHASTRALYEYIIEFFEKLKIIKMTSQRVTKSTLIQQTKKKLRYKSILAAIENPTQE